MVSIVLITTIAYASLPLIASHSETRHTSISASLPLHVSFLILHIRLILI
jgi:hypothetical protein